MNNEILEQWRDVVWWEGLYLVSIEGVVISKLTGKIIKDRLNRDYMSVTLRRGKKSTTRKVHRLIAEAFISKPDGKTEVNHKDGNKLNNSINNLEWVTRQENILHAQSIGLGHHKGARSHLAKPVYISINREAMYFGAVNDFAAFLSCSKQQASLIIVKKLAKYKSYEFIH